jgi:hypothetical protein
MKYNLVGIMYGRSRKHIPNFVPIIDSFQKVLDHTCDFHGNMVLKVKSLELIITTGKFG